MTFALKGCVQYVQDDDDGTGSTFLQSFCQPPAEPLPFYCTEWVVSHYPNKRTNSILCLPHILKGTVPRDYRYQNFFINQFQASESTIRAVSTTPAVLVANVPPVSLIPVVHLDLRIFSRIFENFEMTLMLLSGAWGKMIHERNLKQKILWHCPFKYNIYYFAGCLTSMRLILRSRSIVTLI